MSFPRIRPPNQWFGTVSSAEFEQFDQNSSRAVDGFGGGSYAPLQPIVIGGAGLEVSTELYAVEAEFGELEVNGPIEVEGTGIYGEVPADTQTFNGKIIAQGGFETNALTVAGGTSPLLISGPSLLIAAPTTYSNTATFNGTVTVGDSSGDAFNVVATANFGVSNHVGLATFATMSLTDRLGLTGAGRVDWRHTAGSNIDGTVYSVSTSDLVVTFPILSASRGYVLDNVGAGPGSRIMFVNQDPTYVVALSTNGGSDVYLLGPAPATMRWIMLGFISGAWHRLAPW